MALAIGQRFTLLRIDDWIAMTHRYEMEVRQVVAPEKVGYQGLKTRLAVVRQRGKRKEVYLDLDGDDILLDGWDLPFQTDGEAGGVMAGNACYNLVGEPEAIRQCIETLAVVPVTEAAKSKVIVSRTKRTNCSEEGQDLLYPDISTGHAVVCRLKEAHAVS
jgi:hypothetical protein